MASSDFFAVFQHFRRILRLNNRVIEKIAAMERALGGEYVFDRAFLHSSITELNRLVREVVYNLNAMAGDHFLGLYDRFEAIRANLLDLLAGGQGGYSGQLVLPYATLHRDLDLLVGAKNANLGEIRNSLNLRTPNGFAVTAAAYQLFMEENGLAARLAAVAAEPADRRAARVKELFEQARVPQLLAEEITVQLKELVAGQGREIRLAVRSSAVGEDGLRTFAGQFRSLLNVRPADLLEAYKQVVASRFSERAADYLEEGAAAHEFPMAVAVQAMVPAAASGVVYTREPTAAQGDLLTVAAVAGTGEALVGGRTGSERYWLERRHPFALRKSRIAAKEVGRPLPDGQLPLASLDSGLRRGSGLLTGEQLSQLAETAMLLEKAFDAPQDIEWALDRQGRVYVLQSRPLHLPKPVPPPPAAVAEELRRAVVLLEGRGQVAQLGIAAGRVMHVFPETDPAEFPVGAIAVCRYASPQLSTIVRKAAALITDIGSSTGHLATIAREYRTPALLGAGNATEILPEGQEITLDLDEKRIYAGVVQGLVSLQASSEEIFLDEPEMRTLRRLLRWIAPITLLDPNSPDFLEENCRTFHDLIRFSHEKAVDTLIHLHSSATEAAGLAGYQLETGLPIKVKVIDLGGGVQRSAGPGPLPVAALQSRPLVALLQGLLNDAAWGRAPAPVGLRDLLSSVTRPLASLVKLPEYAGENLALAARGYCNLSLRLGYHFNVIDAYISADPDDNYIYFRFVGGMAEKARRDRRAALIGAILTSLQFKVDRQGDLLIGKVKMLAPEHMDDILRQIGELIAFTRQLDVRMADDATIDLFFSHFLEQTRQSWANRER